MSDETFEKLSINARAVLRESQGIAQRNHAKLTSGHLLLAIIEVPGTLSHDVLREYSVNFDQISLILNLNSTHGSNSESRISDEIKLILKEAYRVAARYKHFAVDTEHLLVALLADKNFESYKAVLKVGANPDQIRSQIINIFEDLLEMDEMIKRQASVPQNLKSEIPKEEEQQGGFFNTPVSTMPQPPQKTKALEYFANDLVAKAKDKKIDPVIGRDTEINRCIQILLRKSKNNPIFIGDPGVGKTAIIEGLAQRIAQKKVPSRLSVKRIYQLDLGLLVAGTMYRGQFEERLKNVLREIIQDKSSVLFIDEVHSIVGTGSAEGSMDAANLLKPALSKGEIRMIGATTFDEYRKFIEKDAALERRLQPIIVKEPSLSQTVDILNGIKSVYEQHHQVIYDKDAIEAAVKLSNIYISDRFLPDKAIDLIDEAAALKTLTNENNKPRLEDDLANKISEIGAQKERLILEEKFEKAAKIKEEEYRLKVRLEKMLKMSKPQVTGIRVTADDIAKVVSQISGVPVGVISKGETKKLSEIEKNLTKKIIGQKEAIKEIAKSLRRNRAGISPSFKPMGSFVFIGPSGVGKTELAKVLSEQLFAHNSLVKIDMSEFMERHNTARLVGAPPGYVGYEDAGKLTEKVRKNPYSVVLFDEIEKAHPEIFNLLLQILDSGELTDAKGRNVNFKNTIIIMTSNVGLEEFDSLKKIGFEIGERHEDGALEGRVSQHLFDLFRPEFINRIDKIIFFNPLKKSDLEQIASIRLDDLEKNLEKQNIYVGISPSVLRKLIKEDYDIVFGARPLIRAIEDEVETFLSDKIISGEIAKQQKYLLEFKNGKYRLKNHRS